MSKRGQGPAYPVSRNGFVSDSDGKAVGEGYGMSIRQRIASEQMAAFISGYGRGAEALNADKVAGLAFVAADALLAAEEDEE